MNVPEDLRYSSDHEWVRVEGDLLRIGITDYAQDSLGDVVFVEVPEVGNTYEAGDAFGEVESTKSVSEIYAPVGGKIVEINEDLESSPESINSDPYGTGWIAVMEPTDPQAVGVLMSAADYRQHTEG